MSDIEDTKKRIRELAEKYENYTARNLSEIVKIPSYSGEEEAVIKKLKELCLKAGCDEVRIDGLGNLIGRVGSGDKIIAFDAHIDVVGVGDRSQWESDPFSGLIRDGLVYGRGSADQKGGAASMITAARILKELSYGGNYSVYFTFTVMEEDCDGMCWKYLIEEEKFVPDYFVSTEPTRLRLYRGHRGRMEMNVTFTGVSCHASAPERGKNAAYRAARGALEIEKLNEVLKPDKDNFLGKGTVAVTRLNAGGPSQCAVPDTADFYLDRRLTWGETMESSVKEVESVVKDFVSVEVPYYDRISWKGTKYGQELYFPTWKIEEGHPLVQSGIKAYDMLYGEKPVVGRWTFSTNGVAVCGRHKVPSIGFGPGDESKAHAPNEITQISDLKVCSAFYAMLPYVLE
ncbi:MAG: YgeY family selenium metabolism-linked hydrolase [Spirochaetes bacterium]|nr:YgeY family selenium metabolism-linked hydrolase [Spirochaetota bacterium]